MLVVVVPAHGSPYQALIRDDDTLHGLQALVDGWIEIVRPRLLPSDWVMIVDDEGKLKNKPHNSLGTVLYDSPWDAIAGDIVLCREDLVEHDGYKEPDLVGLTEAEAKDCIERFIPAALGFSSILQ